MAGRKYSDAAKAIHAKVEAANPPKTNWVRYTLSDAEKSVIKATEFGVDEFNECVQSFQEEGFTFSWKFYPEQGTWGCFLNVRNADHKYSGWTLSSRGSTPFKAFKQLAYLHYTRFSDGWPMDVRPELEPIDD